MAEKMYRRFTVRSTKKWTPESLYLSIPTSFGDFWRTLDHAIVFHDQKSAQMNADIHGGFVAVTWTED